MKRILWPVMPLVLLLVTGGCGGGGGGEDDEDTATDTVDDAVDTGTDPGDDTDIPPDSETDTSGDPVTDTGEDSEEDVPEDTAGETPPSGIVGDPCGGDDDCTSTVGTDPYCLEEITTGGGTLEFPNGYCTASCTRDGGECGSGAVCERMGGGGSPRRCFKECTDDADCRETEGYICNEFWSGNSGCIPDFGGP